MSYKVKKKSRKITVPGRLYLVSVVAVREYLAGFAADHSRTRGGDQTADTFRRISVATLNRDTTVLRMMLNKAREMNYNASLVKISRLKGEHHRERIVTPQEETAYLAAAPELLRDLATIALDTGMRPDSEICAMRWENVHLKHGYIHIPHGKSKNARRPIPLTERVRNILERRHTAAGRPDIGPVFAGDGGAPLPYTVIDTQHDRTLEKLNWTTDEPGKRLRIYDFRHSALTRLYQSGAGIFTLKSIAGHAIGENNGALHQSARRSPHGSLRQARSIQ